MRALIIAVGLLCGVAGCDLGNTKANEKVKESNATLAEARKLAEEGDTAKNEAAKATEPAKRKEAAKRCVDKYSEAEKKLDQAGKTLDEASKLKIGKEFSDYLTAKAAAQKKRSEVVSKTKAICEELGGEPTAAAMDKLVEGQKKVIEEANDLDEKAEKIRKDNPTKFKD